MVATAPATPTTAVAALPTATVVAVVAKTA